MSPRPANPPPDRRAEILEAALKVFARKGYEAATNAEIAREAGVTAAALYYYFPGKAELFRAALLSRRSAILPLIEQIGAQLKEMPPQTVLPFVVQNMVQFMSDERTRAVLGIILSEGARHPELLQIWEQDAITPVSGLVFGYLQHQVEQGNIRPIDPRVGGLLAAGTVVLTMIVRDLLKLQLLQGLSNETLAAQLTEVLTAGLILPPGKE